MADSAYMNEVEGVQMKAVSVIPLIQAFLLNVVQNPKSILGPVVVMEPFDGGRFKVSAKYSEGGSVRYVSDPLVKCTLEFWQDAVDTARALLVSVESCAKRFPEYVDIEELKEDVNG